MLGLPEEKSNALQFFKNKPAETNYIYLTSKCRNNLNENEEQNEGKKINQNQHLSQAYKFAKCYVDFFS